MKTIALRKIAQLAVVGVAFMGYGYAASAIGEGPVNALWPLQSNYTSISAAGFCANNSRGLHIGIDVEVPEGKPVYSVCDGTVKLNNTSKHYSTLNLQYWNSFLIIEHNCGGNIIYGYYGHLTSTLSSGAKVKVGDTVGSIRASYDDNDQRTTKNDHLHLGVSTQYRTNSWGYESSCSIAEDKGWKDPRKYFNFALNSGVELKSVYVTCPSSINENSSGVCTAVASYSDKSSKSVIPTTWSSNNASLSVSSNGRISAGSVSRDITGVGVTGVYKEGGKTVQGTAQITIKDVPAPLPTLKSVYVTCPSSINENSSGICTTKASYTNGSEKAVTPSSWRVTGSGLSINSSGNITTGSVPSNTNVSVTGIYSEGGKTEQGTAQITIKDVPAPLPTLSSLYVTCPSSINENSSGVCTANVYYSNGGSKAVTPSWKVGGGGLSISSNGNIATGSVSSNTNASVTGIYSEGGKTVQGTAPITIKDVPAPDVWTGKNPNGTVCEKDGQTVASKVGKYGTLELRWSNTCKTNWARITPKLSSYKTEVKVERSSDRRTYSYSGKGTTWTDMVHAPNVSVCASGKVNGESLSGACR